MVVRDKFGDEIQEFDLIKVFHFVGQRRKKHYMYKWVIQTERGLRALHLSNTSNGGYYLRYVCDKEGVLKDTEIIQSNNPEAKCNR